MPEPEKPPRRSTARRPWYEAGLRFACVPDCGACCTRHGEYDYVYLEPGDVERLAALHRLDREAWIETYAFVDDGHLALRMNGPDCPFLEGTACSVYEARPSQCRTFPFWRENLRSRAAWECLRAFCPGIGEGELHAVERIRGAASTKSGS